jgi:hypothetical protein
MRRIGGVTCRLACLDSYRAFTAGDFEPVCQRREMLECPGCMWIAIQPASRLHFHIIPFRLTGKARRTEDLQSAKPIYTPNLGSVCLRRDLDRVGVRCRATRADEIREADLECLRQTPDHGKGRIGLSALNLAEHRLRHTGLNRKLLECQLAQLALLLDSRSDFRRSLRHSYLLWDHSSREHPAPFPYTGFSILSITGVTTAEKLAKARCQVSLCDRLSYPLRKAARLTLTLWRMLRVAMRSCP